jgi:hypothetical protein
MAVVANNDTAIATNPMRTMTDVTPRTNGVVDLLAWSEQSGPENHGRGRHPGLSKTWDLAALSGDTIECSRQLPKVKFFRTCTSRKLIVVRKHAR